MTTPDNLDKNTTDKMVLVTRAVTGVIPFAGSVVSEIITTLIPNQRMDRIVDFIRRLEARIGSILEQTNITGINDLDLSLLICLRMQFIKRYGPQRMNEDNILLQY
jgi:hypothetical protein